MILPIVSTLLSATRHVLIVYCLRVSVSKIGVSATNVKNPVAFSTNIASKHKSNTFRW
jgi:hypothetical protein